KTMWTQPCATFHGKYFHVEDALLEPKPVQKPHPPIMIGGGGEQLTLRALARVGDACNFFGDVATVKHKYEVLRQHCETEGRDYDSIERTNLAPVILARDEAALKAKRERLGIPDQVRGFAVTVSQAIDVLGRYQDAGTQLLITSFYHNELDSMELLASDVMPHFK
ncbi:MAG TPA: LLM class flavin-dependent oxidoreductase, partial [Anaerolineae bacterium]|nr:LLM class flavin-dependent oxidoreductase [Anaerolineae bacterium]